MNSLHLALAVALAVSLVANALFFWYIRKTTNRLLFISQNLNDLVSLIAVYRENLRAIYEMEMFYGDESLQNLIGHTRSLYSILEGYEDIVYLTEPIEFEYDENEDNDESEENEPGPSPETDVLYAGSRRRNS